MNSQLEAESEMCEQESSNTSRVLTLAAAGLEQRGIDVVGLEGDRMASSTVWQEFLNSRFAEMMAIDDPDLRLCELYEIAAEVFVAGKYAARISS